MSWIVPLSKIQLLNLGSSDQSRQRRSSSRLVDGEGWEFREAMDQLAVLADLGMAVTEEDREHGAEESHRSRSCSLSRQIPEQVP